MHVLQNIRLDKYIYNSCSSTSLHGDNLVYKNIRGFTDILMLIQTNKNGIMLGCFMSSIDCSKSGNCGTGESFLYRITENKEVDSWFWNEKNQNIFALFDKQRYQDPISSVK